MPLVNASGEWAEVLWFLKAFLTLTALSYPVWLLLMRIAHGERRGEPYYTQALLRHALEQAARYAAYAVGIGFVLTAALIGVALLALVLGYQLDPVTVAQGARIDRTAVLVAFGAAAGLAGYVAWRTYDPAGFLARLRRTQALRFEDAL